MVSGVSMKNNGAYDLVSVPSSRLAGFSLRLAADLLENPVARVFLAGSLIKSAGVDKLRELNPEQQPTFYPIHRCLPGIHNEVHIAVESHPLKCQGSVYLSIHDYVEGYRNGCFTPEMAAENILKAIETSDEGEWPLRAFIAVNADDVLAQARASTERYLSGRPLGPLDGVPVAIKDEIDMLLYGTTVGTKFLGKRAAQQDATVVARLRTAGALLPGKTNMHEIGIGVTGLNIYHGTTRNPYNLNRHTGGSSSGSAAAVAAGLVPAALGADAGGSIRVPASLCGVVGLKPTFGRVSEIGAAPLCWSMGHIGPLAATAADAALIYSVIAGPDPCDPNSLHQPPMQQIDFDRDDLDGIKLGVFWPWFNHAQPEIVAACSHMLEEFERRGAQIVEVEIPGLEAARVAHLITIVTEMNANLSPYGFRELCPETRAILAIARTLTARDYTAAQQIRTRLLASFQQALMKVDMIITPTTGVTAPPIHPDALITGEYDIHLISEIMRFVFSSNLTGLPAISFPAGSDSKGLPIGMQAIGRAWEEHQLLGLALAAERIVPHQRPETYFSLLPV
jgi:Asp-tRNA(Asn)/Glu-tRNA(Gln) amidotransferase A subunit family amidase